MPSQSVLRISATVLILLLPFVVDAKNNEFSGSLQRVTSESISLLLSDGSLVDARIPKTGDSAGTIVNMIQCEAGAIEIPKDFGLDSWKDTEQWDYVKIGDASYLLPVSLDSLIGIVPGDLWRMNVTYTNHRHFEASTNLNFH